MRRQSHPSGQTHLIDRVLVVLLFSMIAFIVLQAMWLLIFQPQPQTPSKSQAVQGSPIEQVALAPI